MRGSVANQLAASLRDMHDEILGRGADYSDILFEAARELDRRSWIPVTERLPDDDVQCLVWHKNGRECRVAVRWEGEFWEGSIRITSNVTHWTSLPAPPSDGK
jgi:hypothetical protein